MTAFKIAKPELLRGVKLARGIAEKKGTMPILANILLRAHGMSGLSLVATDLNISVIAELKSANASEGGMLISAANLYEIVSNAPGDEISVIRLDNSWAEIRSGKAKYKVVGMPDKDFPKVHDRAGAALTAVDSAALREMIDRVAFAVCTDETRTHMTGAFLESDGAEVRMVAAESHRLCVATRKLAGPMLTKGIIIPRKGLGELKKLTEQGPTVGLVVVGNHLFAVQDDVTIAVTLIDMEFVPWRNTIPVGHGNGVIIDRVRLLDALRRQFMVTEQRGAKLEASSGGVVLSCNHPDHGEVSEGLEAEVTGAMTIGFNPKYIAELLNQMSCDQVSLRSGVTGMEQLLITSATSADDYIGIVMPMRVD